MTDWTARVLPDVNVLVALTVSSHVHHLAAHQALAAVQQWHTTPMTEASLMRLLMNPAVVKQPRSASEVARIVRGFAADDRWSFLPDDARLAAVGTDLELLFGHEQVTDFHLLNLALRHGLVVATFDAAFVASASPQNRDHLKLLDA